MDEQKPDSGHAKVFASQNHLPIKKGERAGATSETVSLYHKHTMIHMLSVILPEYPNE